MQIQSQQNNVSFGAIKVPYGYEAGNEAKKVLSKIDKLFFPNGVVGCGSQTMFFKKPGEEDIAAEMLKKAKVLFIQSKEVNTSTPEARQIFANIDIVV